MSRHDLLGWVNDVLASHLVKIEELSTGAAYCQMIDILFPDTINMRKVKFEAKHEYEYIFNLKLVQSGLIRVNVDKDVPIERLIKARFQDNFEFLQWFKKFFYANYNERTYDPISARFHIKLGSGDGRLKKTRSALCVGAKGDRGNFSNASFSRSSCAVPINARSELGESSGETQKTRLPKSAAAAVTLGDLKKDGNVAKLQRKHDSSAKSGTRGRKVYPTERRKSLTVNESSENRASSPATINALNEEANKIKLQVTDAEGVRDFYFEKLQKVELLCEEEKETTTEDNKNLIRSIFNILYSKNAQSSSTESSLSTLI